MRPRPTDHTPASACVWIECHAAVLCTWHCKCIVCYLRWLHNMINYMRAALGPHGLLLSRSHAALMQRTNCAAHPAGSVPAQQQHSWQQARTAAAVTEAGSGAPAAAGAAADADAAAAHAVAAAPPKVRSYPTEPRVGVGMVILRQLTPHKEDAEVLLIRRGKEPNKGEHQLGACSWSSKPWRSFS